MFYKHLLRQLIFVIIVSALALSACAPAATPTPEVREVIRTVEVTTMVEGTPQVIVQEVVVTPTPEPEKEKPTGSLTLWGWSFEVMESTGLIDEFKAEYPDIDVEIVEYASGDTYQNLQLALSAGQGAPDIAQVENSRLAGFVELGGLADITDQVQPYVEVMNDYKWKDAIKDGRYYAMPWDSGPVVLYYRQDVFEQAGLPTDPAEVETLVSTWDGYKEVCLTIKEKTGRDCFAHNKANNYGRLYEMTLWQQGLGYYNDSGEITVDSPENIATLEKLGEFWEAGVVSDQLEWTDGWYAELSSLDAPIATIVEASWMGVFLKTWIAGDTAGRWGVARMPAMQEGQVRAANDGGSTLVITEESQDKEAAWAFIEFMLGRDQSQLKMFAYSDFLPSLETTYEDALFIEPDPFFKGQVARQLYLDVAKEIPLANIYGPQYNLMNGHVSTAIQKFAAGEMSAADALKEAADAIRAETGMP